MKRDVSKAFPVMIIADENERLSRLMLCRLFMDVNQAQAACPFAHRF
jgi:hypothetical protein